MIYVFLLLGIILDFPPIRQKIEHPNSVPTLVDIEQHAKETFKYPCLIVTGHETQHCASNDVLWKYYKDPRFVGKYSGFYLGNNKALMLKEPNLTLQDLAAKIPKEYRDGIYNTYFLNPNKQKNTVLYILDEYGAYVADSQIHREFLDKGINLPNSGLENAKKFRTYCSHLLELVKKDSKYDSVPLKEYIDLLNGRLDKLEGN